MDRIVPLLIVALSFSAGLLAGLAADLPGAETAPQADVWNQSSGDGEGPSEPVVGIPEPVGNDPPPKRAGKGLDGLLCESPMTLATRLEPATLGPNDPMNLTALLHNPGKDDQAFESRRLDVTYYRVGDGNVERTALSTARTYTNEHWTVPANGTVSLAPLLDGMAERMGLDAFEPAGTYALALHLQTSEGPACGFSSFEFTPRP